MASAVTGELEVGSITVELEVLTDEVEEIGAFTDGVEEIGALTDEAE